MNLVSYQSLDMGKQTQLYAGPLIHFSEDMGPELWPPSRVYLDFVPLWCPTSPGNTLCPDTRPVW